MTTPPLIEAQLPFLGTRPYLHGTTLFRFLSSIAPEADSGCFRIVNVIRTDRVAVVTDPSNTFPLAVFDCFTGGRKKSLYVKPLPPSPNVIRQLYDEDEILSRAAFDINKASIPNAVGLELLPAVVPLFKRLLDERGMVQAGGQWMFTRFDWALLIPTVPVSIGLRLDHVRSGLIARATIQESGREIGEIYFSFVRKEAQ
jgi:hypothetical protein